jgi:hypothetical protein
VYAGSSVSGTSTSDSGDVIRGAGSAKLTVGVGVGVGGAVCVTVGVGVGVALGEGSKRGTNGSSSPNDGYTSSSSEARGMPVKGVGAPAACRLAFEIAEAPSCLTESVGAGENSLSPDASSELGGLQAAARCSRASTRSLS